MDVDPHTVTVQRGDNSLERIALQKHRIRLQILVWNRCILFRIILVLGNCLLVVVFALLLLPASLFRKGVWAACLLIWTTRHRRCMMWNTIVPWDAQNLWYISNTSFLEMWMDLNKGPSHTTIEFIGTHMSRTLTHGNLSIAFHAGMFLLTVSTRKLRIQNKLIVASRVYCQYKYQRKPISTKGLL